MEGLTCSYSDLMWNKADALVPCAGAVPLLAEPAASLLRHRSARGSGTAPYSSREGEVRFLRAGQALSFGKDFSVYCFRATSCSARARLRGRSERSPSAVPVSNLALCVVVLINVISVLISWVFHLQGDDVFVERAVHFI